MLQAEHAGRRGGETAHQTFWGGKRVTSPTPTGTCGIAPTNAGVAQAKNRSGLNWFLLSLLLGPIVTLILAAFMAKNPI